MSNNVKGLKELIRTLEQVPKELEEDVEGVLQAVSQTIEVDAKRKAPIDTGKLRQSIKSERVDNKTYRIRANATGLAPYAPFIEFGTRFMRAQPFLFPAFFSGRKRFINALDKLLGDTFNKV